MKATGKAIVALAGATVISLAVVGCGSSNSGGDAGAKSSAAASAPTLTGDPVLIGSMYPLTGQGLNEQTWLAGAKAAVAGINQRGGINGHPVKLDQCDDGNDPNKATACARKFIKDKVIAVAGGVTLFGDKMTPILQNAGIAQIGILPIVPAEYSSPTVFPLDTAGLGTVGGGLYALKKIGAETVYIVAPYSGAASDAAIAFTEKNAAAAGLTVKGVAHVPPSATDYTQYAQAAISSGADAVFTNLAPAQLIPFTRAAQQLNAHFKLGTDGEASPGDYKSLGMLGSSAVYASSYPPISGDTERFPALATYNADMDAELASGDSNAEKDKRTSFTQRAWLAVSVTAQLAEKLEKPDAAGILKALRTEKNIETGMIPAWTPSAKGPTGYRSISNGQMYLLQRDGDGDKLIENDPVDIMKILFPNG
ncbi:ABC transporter substrate-binding protein [Nocardioides terrisoli]|uniref:ABC transporter substrate-binding protein n=1 Tax=Nocardioides terrisoli TaxID=3388267 RepID=UPI00287B9EDB|nr:ABC transporter substrate-binding protein [Nocardioides marmorisolisilvae]